MKGLYLFILILWCSGATLAQDSIPPVVDNIRLYPTIVEPGDTLFIEYRIVDDISGPDYTRGTLRFSLFAPNRFPITAGTNNYWVRSLGSDYFLNSYIIPQNHFTDSIFFYDITVYDIANNITHVSAINPLDSSKILTRGVAVINLNPPPPPVVPIPILDSVWQAGTTNIQGVATDFFVKVHDTTGTPIMSVSCMFRHTLGQTNNSISADTNGVYHCRLNPDRCDIDGDWTLNRISVNYGQFTSHTFNEGVDYTTLPVSYTGSTNDNTPPQLISYTHTPSVVHRGDSVQTIIHTDESVPLMFLGMSRMNQFNQQVQDWTNFIQVAPMTYLSTWAVNDFDANGPWQVWVTNLADSCNNRGSVYTSAGNITVIPDTFLQVTGQVLTSTGDPLALSTVRMVKIKESDSLLLAIRATETDSNGYYSFLAEYRDSVVFIKAVPDPQQYPGEIPTYFNSSWMFAGATAVYTQQPLTNIAPFNTISGANQGGHGFITGYIWQGAGKRRSIVNEWANQEIVLVDHNGDPVAATEIDSSGNYLFSNIPDGDYRFYGNWPNMQTSNAQLLNLSFQANDTLQLDFEVRDSMLVPIITHLKEKLEMVNCQIFPNPGNGSVNINIQSEPGRIYTAVVLDLLGNMVHKNTGLHSGLNKIDLDVPPGIYHVIVSNETGSIVFRLSVP